MTDHIAEQELQTGYRTPDGVEHFEGLPPGPSFFGGDLSTHAGQNRSQELYRAHLKRSGLPENWGRLEFIQRVRTVTYSAVIPLVPSTRDDETDLSF